MFEETKELEFLSQCLANCDKDEKELKQKIMERMIELSDKILEK